MSSFNIRPRFKHLIHNNQENVEKAINDALEKAKDTCIADSLSGHINIKIPAAERHFWSPQLNLTTEQTEDGTVIRGLYGPNPTVWGIFFFGYVSLGLLFMGLGMWGLTRYNLGLNSEILWSLPVLAGCALVLYLIAQFGQKIGADQMYRLHHFYEDIFHDKVTIY